MRLDANYSSIYRCPETDAQLTRQQVMYSRGVCPVCGHDNDSTITHYRLEVGRWKRPNVLEWLLGQRTRWVPTQPAEKVAAEERPGSLQ